jgi:hypothetical protein
MSWGAVGAIGVVGGIYALLRRKEVFQDRKIQSPIRSCKSCSAPIVWLKTVAGKNMPVDADTVKADDLFNLFDSSKHRSHYATCPNAKKHRR